MSANSTDSQEGPVPNGEVIRTGLLKKMKTARKKFFVLRAEAPDALARLEYYDSEKKYKNGVPAKRCIALKTCFDINKRQDTKHKNVIALYTKDDCFCIVLDNEEEMKSWLKDMLTLQHGAEIPEGEIPKPKFEYVWELKMCARGLGVGRTGTYRFCLTAKTITLVKLDQTMPTSIEISLASVRSCGNIKDFFFLEVGRSSNLGAGEIWFEAGDTTIASNLQDTVSHRFKLVREKLESAAAEGTDNVDSKGRTRSSSATEPNKNNNKKLGPLASLGALFPQDGATPESNVTSTVTNSTTSMTGAGLGWSTVANHQRTQSLPFAPIPTTTAGAPLTDNITPSTFTATAITTLAFNVQHPSKRHSQGGPSGKCSLRDRCDSMPTRPRTSSESNRVGPGWGKPYTLSQRMQNHFRDPSHSPPTGSPVSPPSDSTGSSYSLPDEHETVHEMEPQRMYTGLTPDHVIAEEEYPDSSMVNSTEGNYMPMNLNLAGISENDYTEMNMTHVINPNYNSNSASMSSVTSGTPSTDMRFVDYTLDKVCSYVSTDDDDASRPYRTYSIGSKPPEIKPQHVGTPENARVRAFSVGSKTKKHFSRVLPHHSHTSGTKSNSAPILAPDSRTGSSYGSITHETEDMMEMDFTVSGSSRSRTSTNASGSSDARPASNSKNKFFGLIDNWRRISGHDKKTPESSADASGIASVTEGCETSPYVDMTQGQRNSGYMDMSGNTIPHVGHAHSPYMDMSGNNSSITKSWHLNAYSPYMDMSGNSATKEEYMDMSGSSPIRYGNYANKTSRGYFPDGHHNNDYVDMTQTRARTSSNASSRIGASPGSWGSDHNSDYLDMSGKNRRSDRTGSFSSQMSSSPYFDMAVNAQHHRQSSLDGNSNVDSEYGDYLNMSAINLNATSLFSANKKKDRSQPITIQNTSSNQTAKNSSPLSISSLLGIRSSPTSNTPKMNLPLTSYSSLPRQKSPRKMMNTNGSKSNSSTSSSVTTSSSLIFPLSINSPSSPQESSQAGTPSGSGMKVPVSVLNVPYKSNSRRNPNEDDYAMMDFEPNKELNMIAKEESPYMNYCPPGAQAPKAQVTVVSPSDEGDYAIMKPGNVAAKSTTLPRTKNSKVTGSPSTLLTHLSSVALSDRPNLGFKPIREKDERVQSPKPADQVPDRLSQDDSVLEEANMDIEEDSRISMSASVSPASNVSRPNSSNSEIIKENCQRPSSLPGMEKFSRPSSVCSEGLASRLGSNSSVYSSSSSASTVVGVTAPDQTKPDQPKPIRLHYASLDLAADPEQRIIHRTGKTADNETSAAKNIATSFVYSCIDFTKSRNREEFKTKKTN
ncbi:insulin receptor substrate 1 chico isoform X2 [Rhynchophorus ferrugineus]|uniref:insulin receptor substrate 1 chico isoform X2 n=1 Tax=Rhynchophorus ferrugineus TaxID=354439 RepID=UPI003FCEBBE9